MTEKEALIALNMIDGIGSVRLKALFAHFNSPQDILKASFKDLVQVDGIGSVVAEKIIIQREKNDLDKELTLIEKEKVSVLTLNDSGYPSSLKDIDGAPIVLYVKGKLESQDIASISIVGSRRASYYGISQAERFAYNLANLGITIVSGMARGVDTASHKGALKAKGRTIAVLGSGLKRIYPPENRELFYNIVDNGAVISEFPMQTPPQACNFPRRNRIISGLSEAVLVIEAARNSGALITADFALEQGKDVFALPGKVDSPTSFGTNELIKQGAKPITCIEDILEELKVKLEIQKQAYEPKKEESRLSCKINLSEQERKILEVLSSWPLHIEVISQIARLDLSEVMRVLMKLELNHIVKQLPGKQYILNEAIIHV